MLIQDLVYELASGDPLKSSGVKKMKVSEAMIWMIIKEKKAYAEWMVQRNFKDLQ